MGSSGQIVTGVPIVFDRVSKNFGDVAAVVDLGFVVQPGRVTGFLGPNGAGKTTSLRILLGLVTASAGTATIGGEAYLRLRDPMRAVGSTLEVSFHPGLTGRGHLRVLTAATGIDRGRVDAVLEQVGMSEHADRRIGGYSMGMRQRLGLATALLGDPGVLVLDEPINGLDPEGIRWIRGLLRALADEGRTILLSSHLLTEVQQTVDDVVVIASGRQRYVGPLAALGASTGPATVVDAADRRGLAVALTIEGHEPVIGPEGLTVIGLDPDAVGRLALAAGIPLRALGSRSGGLEDDFLALVSEPQPVGPEPVGPATVGPATVGPASVGPATVEPGEQA